MTAGSSTTPQARKLGLRPGCRLILDHAPAGWAVESPPPAITSVSDGGPADVVITVVTARAELAGRIGAWEPALRPGDALWVAWPRRAAGHRSDVTDDIVRAEALRRGLVDVKVAALDADWSALKLVRRRLP